MLIYQFHLISRKCYNFLTFINRVTSGNVFSAVFTDSNFFAKNALFSRGRSCLSGKLILLGHSQDMHGPITVWCDVVWDAICYVMWCDVMCQVMWCDVNALMSNRRQVISKKHQQHMMTSSNGNIFRVTGHLCGEFTQRPVTRSFDVCFDLNKWLSKQWWGWWSGTLSCPLWRHCNEHVACVTNT